jgi:hypothetical protein
LLVQLDVRAVHVPQFADGILGQPGEQAGKQAGSTTAAVPGKHRVPRPVALRQVAPRHAGLLRHQADLHSVHHNHRVWV